MSEEWYARHDGKSFGPMTRAELVASIHAGTIPQQAMLKRASDEKWGRVFQYKGLMEPTISETPPPVPGPVKVSASVDQLAVDQLTVVQLQKLMYDDQKRYHAESLKLLKDASSVKSASDLSTIKTCVTTIVIGLAFWGIAWLMQMAEIDRTMDLIRIYVSGSRY